MKFKPFLRLWLRRSDAHNLGSFANGLIKGAEYLKNFIATDTAQREEPDYKLGQPDFKYSAPLIRGDIRW